MSAGTFTPAPGAAPLGRQVLSHARMEARLMLRNGEQLLLAVVIPVIVLVGAVAGSERVGLELDAPARTAAGTSEHDTAARRTTARTLGLDTASRPQLLELDTGVRSLEPVTGARGPGDAAAAPGTHRGGAAGGSAGSSGQPSPRDARLPGRDGTGW